MSDPTRTAVRILIADNNRIRAMIYLIIDTYFILFLPFIFNSGYSYRALDTDPYDCTHVQYVQCMFQLTNTNTVVSQNR